MNAQSRHAKGPNTSAGGFFWDQEINKKTRKPKCRLITTTMQFSLQDFHKGKNFHKLNFCCGNYMKAFPFCYFYCNHYTLGYKYLSTLFCPICPLYPLCFVKKFCKWHSNHLPLRCKKIETYFYFQYLCSLYR